MKRCCNNCRRKRRNIGCGPCCIAFGIGVLLAMFCSWKMLVFLCAVVVFILAIQLIWY